MKNKLKSQKGMTLVELILAVAVTGIIITFTGTAIYQILNISGYGNDRLSAQHELQNAAAWFHQDAQGAVTAGGGSQLTMMLSDNSTVIYTLTGTELKRTSGTIQTTLARNINSAFFSVNGRLATMSLSCVPSWRDTISENGTYTVFLRPVEAN